MPKLFLKTLGLFLLFPLFYFAHRYLLLPLFENTALDFLNFSYIYNFGATVAILLMIFLVALVSTDYLGFIFLVFGFLKLGLFMLMAKKLSFVLDRSLFLHFFIPYLVGLGIEIFILIQQLKGGNPHKTS